MNPEFRTVIKSVAASAKESVRESLLKLLAAASSARGANCLSRDETVILCKQLGYDYQPGEPTTFTLNHPIDSLEIMRCGVVRLNHKHCLYTDFGNRAAAIDFARPKLHVDHVLAVWSHRWLGFHHFLSELFPKICRLRNELGYDLGGARICYPKIHRRYESELLEMLDLPKDRVVDTWEVGGVVAEKLTIVPMAGWFQGNPNADLLRQQLIPPAHQKGPERLYLSRSGRRRCLNDKAIIERCKELGFVVVDESSRTIAEQISLYRDARILFGPHGSAFTNMVWAAPGAHIIEMIPSTFDVTYHAGLTRSLGHRYTKIACPNGPTATSGVTIDFNAEIETVLKVLNESCG
ncbi:MAG: glycosyltransferase family 61 protein [Luteolibacter sp.]